MTGWTEATLRAAASWQAFKEGKSLLQGGAVTEAKAGQSGWQGTVRCGQRLHRVQVVVKSNTDLATRCSCPQNQTSGEFCAHAVAVGLATLAAPNTVSSALSMVMQGSGPGGTLSMRAQAKETPKLLPSPAVAWQILLPLNWRDALVRGKFAATLATAPDSEISPADDRLNAWLACERVVSKAILSLNLAGQQVAAFLEAIADHPRLAAGKDRLSITIRAGERFHLSDASVQGNRIRLVPDRLAVHWLEIGGSFWQISQSTLTRVGEGSLPGDLEAALGEISRGQTVEIPTDLFLNRLDAWQEWVAFPADSWLEALHFVPAPVAIELSLEGSLQYLEARLLMKYGSAPAVAPGLGTVAGLPSLLANRCEVRNLAAEELAVNRLAMAGFQPQDHASGHWLLRDESAILNFLTRSLPALRQQWSVSEDQRFHLAQQQIAVVAPKIQILDSGNDWLSFDLSFQTNAGVAVPTAEVRRLLRAGKGSVKIAGGRHLVISDAVSEIIDPIFSELDLHQENGRFMASARSGEIIIEIGKRLSKSLSVNDLPSIFPFAKPATLRADLRPYQSLGAGWLGDRVVRFGGALLADDMGLGKTLQAIACVECLLDAAAADSGVVLVVATASLIGNWQAEFARFAPARGVRILHGPGRDAEREKVSPGEVVLTSFGTLARDLAWHLQRDYRAVVVDEASLMRNPDTDHAKAVCKLRTSHRIALTGTPIENGVRDLWSIFRFIQPGWLGSRAEFKERYELPLAGGQSAAAVMERLRLKISPFLLRRTKQQVAPELPSKIFIDEFCDLSPDQHAVYKELLTEGRKLVDASAHSGNPAAARMQMLTALLRLRQTCCDLALLGGDRFNRLLVPRRSAKLQRLLELLDEAVNGSHRVLVFSQFQKQLLEIEKCILERGWDSLRLDGQSRNRQQLVDKFQQADGPPVFLISLKAGGYGLNLTAADTVVHFDPWWNPAAEMQATDRAHRIGQTRPVTVYRLLTRGTVEEKVVRLQARKRELSAAIDESGVGEASGWSTEDLKAVLADA